MNLVQVRQARIDVSVSRHELAAYTAGLMAVTSGFLGNLAGGWVADWCARRWRGGRSWSLVLLTLFFAPFSAAFFVLPPSSSPQAGRRRTKSTTLRRVLLPQDRSIPGAAAGGPPTSPASSPARLRSGAEAWR